ncbi:TFIIH subunit Tfb4/p34 [Carpediemonas membranifera]|uniref:TFIIH subunit Tfb4/p34 n=1 Tax=Carpediemonas membranifera TaxID=201153 RepID=A0A8J6DZN3_9EUKA|nr:TFIIH subunit Tfb4/p34 [Carpediemonas membranifera]|eukprot:KAG9393879.1 TFIIH subunit Tfb4/p34 [Carpediemonas membranifera]
MSAPVAHTAVPECLFVILDVPKGPFFQEIVESVLALVNLHLVSNSESQFAILASSQSAPNVIFSTFHRPNGISLAPVEHSASISDLIRDALDRLPTGRETSCIVSAFMSALCMANKLSRLTVTPMPSRFLLLSARPVASGVSEFVNSFFMAQREGWPVDCCYLGSDSTPVPFQQAADLTGGHLLSWDLLDPAYDNAAFPTAALVELSVPVSVRRVMPVVPGRAAAGAHNAIAVDTGKTVAFGFVCSACMAVHERFVHKCAGCGTELSVIPRNPG